LGSRWKFGEGVVEEGEWGEGNPNVLLPTLTKIEHRAGRIEAELAIVSTPITHRLEIDSESPSVVNSEVGENSVQTDGGTDDHEEVKKVVTTR
jgi:hypothetical protein